MRIQTLLLLAGILLIVSCNRKTAVTESSTTDEVKELPLDYTGPPTIVYKTKNNYYHKVPVTFSKDGKSIASWPDIKDIYFKGELALPTELPNGYLLDNRGIDQYVAFLNMTYEEYSKLEKTPTADELMGFVLDKDPLLEIYNCGNRYQYKDLVQELSKLAASGAIKQCRKLEKEKK